MTIPFSSNGVNFYGATGQNLVDSHLEVDPAPLALDILQFLLDNPNVLADGEVHDDTIIIHALSGTTRNFEETSRFRKLFSKYVDHFYMKGLVVSADTFNRDKLPHKRIVLVGGKYHGRELSTFPNITVLEVTEPITSLQILESVLLSGVQRYERIPNTFWNFREVFAIVNPVGFLGSSPIPE